MPSRRPGRSFPVLLLLGVAAPVLALPPLGAFSLDVGGHYAFLSTRDIEALYAPLTLDNHKSYAAGWQGGFLYNVSDSFQLGAGVDQVIKQYRVRWPNQDTDFWRLPVLGVVGRARWLMSGPSRHLWYALSAAAGDYRLSGASLHYNGVDWHYRFSGSTVGGLLSLDSEYRFGESVAAAAMLGYRLVAVRTIKATLHPDGTSVTLRNGDDTKAHFDYSGAFLSVALRFYIGGDGSSVTSE